MKVLARRVSLCLVAAALFVPANAAAHEGADPAAHVAMPTQITAGLTSLCPMKVSSGARTARSIACFGGEVSLAFSPVPDAEDTFALRLRFGYANPLLEQDSLAQGSTSVFQPFHEFRALLSPEYVAVRLGDTFHVTVGPSLGFEGVLVGPRGGTFLPAIHVGGVVGLRGFVTYHTGFFAEASFGAGFTIHDTADLNSRSLGRVTLGWIDRF